MKGPFVLPLTEFVKKGEPCYLTCSLHSNRETNQKNANKGKVPQAAACLKRWWVKTCPEDRKTERLVWGWEQEGVEGRATLRTKNIFFKCSDCGRTVLSQEFEFKKHPMSLIALDRPHVTKHSFLERKMGWG